MKQFHSGLSWHTVWLELWDFFCIHGNFCLYTFCTLLLFMLWLNPVAVLKILHSVISPDSQMLYTSVIEWGFLLRIFDIYGLPFFCRLDLFILVLSIHAQTDFGLLLVFTHWNLIFYELVPFKCCELNRIGVLLCKSVSMSFNHFLWICSVVMITLSRCTFIPDNYIIF